MENDDHVPFDRLLTESELAKMMNVSLCTVQRLRTQRVLPFYKIGRSVRFHRHEVADYLKTTGVSSIKEYERTKNTK